MTGDCHHRTTANVEEMPTSPRASEQVLVTDKAFGHPVSPSHQLFSTASPTTRPASPLVTPLYEIDTTRIRFEGEGDTSPQGGFALVRRAVLLHPTAEYSNAGENQPRTVAVKILKVSDTIDAERLRKVSQVISSDPYPHSFLVASDSQERLWSFRQSAIRMFSNLSVTSTLR